MDCISSALAPACNQNVTDARKGAVCAMGAAARVDDNNFSRTNKKCVCAGH